MGLTTALERRASPEAPTTSLSNPAPWLMEALGGEETPAGVRVNEKSAMRFSAVFACVRILAETLAYLPLPVYERLEPRGKRRATDHPNYQLLHDRPNPEMSSFNFREVLQAHLALWGNAWAEKEMTEGGRIRALWPLLPNQTRAERINGRKVVITRVDGREIGLPMERVVHIPGLGFNGLMGMSPIRMAMKSIGLGLAAEEFGSRFYGQGATMSGVLKAPTTLSDKARHNLMRSVEMRHQGLSKSHRFMLLEEGLEYEKIGIPPGEAQFLELRKFQLNEIARIYRVPPHMIADLDRPFQSNVEQMGLDFVRHTMGPWLVRWEQVMNWDMFTEEERSRFFAEFLVEGLLRGDSQARAAYYKERWQMGSMSANDIRERENENPIPGGDQYFVPLNFMPLDEASRGLGGRNGDGGGERSLPSGDQSDSGRALIETRSVALRRRIQQAHSGLFRDAFRRAVRREAEAGKAAARRATESQSDVQAARADFKSWADDFYPGHQDYVAQQAEPAVAAMGAAIWAAAAEEIGGDPELSPEAGAFFKSYTESLARSHVASSMGQLGAIADNSETVEALAENLVARMEEWEETRPDKVANNETVRLGSATSKAVWAAAGILRLRWTTNGTGCPICREMNGRVVSITAPFVRQGEEVDPDDGETTPLVSKQTIRHPPLHQGCDCGIVPG